MTEKTHGTGGDHLAYLFCALLQQPFYGRHTLSWIVGYRMLPVSALPEVDYPTIQVVTLS